MKDEFREVREGMLTTLAKNFQFLNLPLNYAAIVALAVGDEDPKIAITVWLFLITSNMLRQKYYLEILLELLQHLQQNEKLLLKTKMHIVSIQNIYSPASSI